MDGEDDVFCESADTMDRSSQKIDQSINRSPSLISKASELDPASEENKPRIISTARLIDKFRALEQSGLKGETNRYNKKGNDTISNKQPLRLSKLQNNGTDPELTGGLRKKDANNFGPLVDNFVCIQPEFVKHSFDKKQNNAEEIPVKAGNVKELLKQWNYTNESNSEKKVNIRTNLQQHNEIRNQSLTLLKSPSSHKKPPASPATESIKDSTVNLRADKVEDSPYSALIQDGRDEADSPKPPASQLVMRPEEEIPKEGTVKFLLQMWNYLLEENRQKVKDQTRSQKAIKKVEEKGTKVSAKQQESKTESKTKIPQKTIDQSTEIKNEKKKVHFNEEVEELDEESGKIIKRRSITEENLEQIHDIDVKQNKQLPWTGTAKNLRQMYENQSDTETVTVKKAPNEKSYKWKVAEAKPLNGIVGAARSASPRLDIRQDSKSEALDTDNKNKIVIQQTTQISQQQQPKEQQQQPNQELASAVVANHYDEEDVQPMKPIYKNDINEFPEEFNTRNILAKFRALEVN